jgi:hypothetical protein
MRLDAIAEISKSQYINMHSCTVDKGNIWRIALRSPQRSPLGFLHYSEAINNYTVDINSINIDNIWYSKKLSFLEMFSAEGSFFFDGDILFVHCINHAPLWLFSFSTPSYQVNIGFTSAEKALRFGGTVYLPSLNSFPAISDEADNLEYQRMKFHSGALTLANDTGEYDTALSFLGNNCGLKYSVDGGTPSILESFYIKSIKLTLDSVAMTLSDRRENLTYTLPSKYFTKEDYPFGETDSYNNGNLYGKLKQDAYGYCINVPALCVNAADTSVGYRLFYVARDIHRIEKLEVKMSQPDTGGEVWTNQTGYTEIVINNAEKLIKLPDDKCMPAKTEEGETRPEVYDVRVSGYFVYKLTPLEIIKELFSFYANLAYTDENFDTQEMTSELAPLNSVIGICFQKEMNLFEAVEQLQDSSKMGFQLITKGAVFSARRDNNNRPPWGTIPAILVTNLDEVEIEMDTESYATSVKVNYGYDYYNEVYQHIVNDTYRQPQLNIFHKEKIYESSSLLKDAAAAADKAERLAAFFSKPRQMIYGVKLYGLEYLSLRVYDILTIDLTLDVTEFTYRERHIGAYTQEQVDAAIRRQRLIRRDFGGCIKCKVMKIQIDLEQITNTIDLLFIG